MREACVLMPSTRDRPDVVSSALASAGGAVEALGGVGLILDAEASEWNARVWAALTGEASESRPTRKKSAPGRR
jgi:hypothetical protein